MLKVKIVTTSKRDGDMEFESAVNFVLAEMQKEGYFIQNCRLTDDLDSFRAYILYKGKRPKKDIQTSAD